MLLLSGAYFWTLENPVVVLEFPRDIGVAEAWSQVSVTAKLWNYRAVPVRVLDIDIGCQNDSKRSARPYAEIAPFSTVTIPVTIPLGGYVSHSVSVHVKLQVQTGGKIETVPLTTSYRVQ